MPAGWERSWIRRFAVGRGLVVAVVAVITVALAACGGPGRGPVPGALVGLWRGGAHSNGAWCYEFSADGAYRAWPEGAPDAVNEGTVVVDDATITFSNGGVPVTSTWSLANGVLLLDGQRYGRVADGAGRRPP